MLGNYVWINYNHILSVLSHLLQTPNRLDKSREQALTPERLMQHVNALSKTIDELEINASLIWNMDESMVDVSSETSTKVITLAEATKTYAKAATPPNHITLIGTIG